MKEYFCGPDYFNKTLKKYLSKDFNLHCQIHDISYSLKNKSRKEIDKIFLNGMLKTSNTKRKALKAYMYYFAVRVFGWTQYGK